MERSSLRKGKEARLSTLERTCSYFASARDGLPHTMPARGTASWRTARIAFAILCSWYRAKDACVVVSMNSSKAEAKLSGTGMLVYITGSKSVKISSRSALLNLYITIGKDRQGAHPFTEKHAFTELPLCTPFASQCFFHLSRRVASLLRCGRLTTNRLQCPF